MNTSDEAQVLEVDLRVSSADWVPLIRTSALLIGEDGRVISFNTAWSSVSKVDTSELTSAVITISDAIDTAHWVEVIGAVGNQLRGVGGGLLEHTLTLVFEGSLGLIELTEVQIGLVVGTTDRFITIGAVG